MGHHVAVPHPKVLREALSHFVEQTFPSRYQHYVDPRRRDLPRKFLAYSRRGTRDKCPGTEPFFIECCSHLFAPFCLLRACCVINHSAANGRGLISQSPDFCQPVILAMLPGGLRINAG